MQKVAVMRLFVVVAIILGACLAEQGRAQAPDDTAEKSIDEIIDQLRKEHDDPKVRYVHLLALSGEPEAQVAMGRRAFQDQEYREAVHWFRTAAEQNDAAGQYHLGYLYAEGRGVEKDSLEASVWYQRAAEQGFANAQLNLGLLYEEGLGVNQDYAEAAWWYRKAAGQGLALAQTKLGLLYQDGSGVSKDIAMAIRYLRKAAVQDEEYAQLYLGLFYEEGRGVPVDLERARFWYRKAVDQGNARALERLSRLGQ